MEEEKKTVLTGYDDGVGGKKTKPDVMGKLRPVENLLKTKEGGDVRVSCVLGDSVMPDDGGGGQVCKPVVLGGVETVVGVVKSDEPVLGADKDERREGTFMGSSHVLERKPGQPSEGGSASFQSKIHYFEKQRGLQSGNLTGDYALCGRRRLGADRDRK